MRLRTRSTRAFVVVGIGACLALVTAAAPAGAGVEGPLDGLCSPHPEPGDADGTIFSSGFDVFNLTGEKQSAGIETVPGGPAARYEISYVNTDDVVHDIVLRGDLDGASPAPGVVIKAFRQASGKNVTDKVFGLSGLRYRNLNPSSGTGTLLVKIRMKADANPDALIDVFMTGNYETASFCGDTVHLLAGGAG